jgi:hypothetical protein
MNNVFIRTEELPMELNSVAEQGKSTDGQNKVGFASLQ